MFRITLETTKAGPTIKLEGRLVGPWVDEFQKFWQSSRLSDQRDQIRVDLKAVTSVDEIGKSLLKEIHQQGGTLIASGCLTKAIVEEVTAQARPDLKQTEYESSIHKGLLK